MENSIGISLGEKYMNLTMLGTGNALVTECYNTCFILQEDNEYFLVDGGGGSTILHQLKYAGIDWKNVKTIFVTHKHIDHILGIIWMIRIIGQKMNGGKYDGNVIIKAHDEVKALLYEMAEKYPQYHFEKHKGYGTKAHYAAVDEFGLCEIHRKSFFKKYFEKRENHG